MAARSLEARLARVAELRANPTEAESEIPRFLRQKSNLLVSRAAEVVGALELESLYPLLAETFFRFMAEEDPTCRAKTAIARVLSEREHRADEVFEAGVRHVQLEAVWGGREDVAVELRCISADVLVRVRHPEVMERLVELLVDPERGARVAAARAIGDTGRRDGIPLLRYKILLGDEEPEVLTEAFSSLLRVDESCVDFVVPFLGDAARFESAALALGDARVSGTETVLITALEGRPPAERHTLRIALAMMRTKTALDHLLEVVKRGDPADAKSAAEALRIYRHDEALMARLDEVLRDRPDLG